MSSAEGVHLVGGPGSIPGVSRWYLYWGKLYSEDYEFLLSASLRHCSILILRSNNDTTETDSFF